MMIKNPLKISDLKPDEIKELQSLLSRLGFYPASQVDGIFGKKTQAAWHKFKEQAHLGDLDLIGPSSYEMLVEAAKNEKNLIARPQFDRIYRYATPLDRDKYFIPINRACAEFEINNLRRLAAFLAQVGHESGTLRYSEEIASGIAYEGRRDLGNIYPGDGVKYKGSGLIQLTGRSNHRWAGQKLGLPLLEKPELGRKDPFVSARIAGLFWKEKSLNELADQGSIDSYKKITKRINGGYNGWEDRVKRYQWAKAVLGC